MKKSSISTLIFRSLRTAILLTAVIEGYNYLRGDEAFSVGPVLGTFLLLFGISLAYEYWAYRKRNRRERDSENSGEKDNV